MRRRLEPRSVRDAAARQQRDVVGAGEPGDGLGRVARVRVLGQEARAATGRAPGAAWRAAAAERAPRRGRAPAAPARKLRKRSCAASSATKAESGVWSMRLAGNASRGAILAAPTPAATGGATLAVRGAASACRSVEAALRLLRARRATSELDGVGGAGDDRVRVLLGRERREHVVGDGATVAAAGAADADPQPEELLRAEGLRDRAQTVVPARPPPARACSRPVSRSTSSWTTRICSTGTLKNARAAASERPESFMYVSGFEQRDPARRRRGSLRGGR